MSDWHWRHWVGESPRGSRTPFGLNSTEFLQVLRWLDRQGVKMELVSYHLRANFPNSSRQERALAAVAAVCGAADWNPRFVDCGGGLPPLGTRDLEGRGGREVRSMVCGKIKR